MFEEHPNVTIMKRLEPKQTDNEDNLFAENFVWRFVNPEAANLFAEDFVWHFFNDKLPDIRGDYHGLEGLQTFFEKLEVVTGGTFRVEPVWATPIGDELVVTHVKDKMVLQNKTTAIDAVVVWRIVNSLIVEAWDIPSIYSERLATT